MLRFLLFCCLLTTGATITAQPGGGFQRIRQARELHLKNYLSLTEAEAERFFPVFYQYEGQLRRLRARGRVAGLAPARGEDPAVGTPETNAPPARQLSEAEARERLEQMRTIRRELFDLQQEAEDAYLKVLPANKVILLEPAERAFNRKLMRRLGERRNRSRR